MHRSPLGRDGYRKNPSSTQWVVALMPLAPAAREDPGHARWHGAVCHWDAEPTTLLDSHRFCATRVQR